MGIAKVFAADPTQPGQPADRFKVTLELNREELKSLWVALSECGPEPGFGDAQDVCNYLTIGISEYQDATGDKLWTEKD